MALEVLKYGKKGLHVATLTHSQKLLRMDFVFVRQTTGTSNREETFKWVSSTPDLK